MRFSAGMDASPLATRFRALSSAWALDAAEEEEEEEDLPRPRKPPVFLDEERRFSSSFFFCSAHAFSLVRAVCVRAWT